MCSFSIGTHACTCEVITGQYNVKRGEEHVFFKNVYTVYMDGAKIYCAFPTIFFNRL